MESDSAQLPVTNWLRQAEAGDEAARQKLWESYYRRLVNLARTHLREGARRVSDEDDVVLDAFNSFFSGIEEGRFPKLNDRNDLWQVLVMLTCRKSSDQMKYQARDRRGGGQVRGESIFEQLQNDSNERGNFDCFEGPDISPDLAVEVAENVGRLLDKLRNEKLRRIALWKLEGFQNAEIAEKLSTTTRTVERKLRLIRGHWEAELGQAR